MPKEAFGGDDDSEAAPEERKKIPLSKFGLSPDTNIRDVFWRIMGSYATTKGPGEELKALEHDRFALMRAALSVISSPHSGQYGLAPRFIALYSLMMMLDGGWADAFAEFLEKGVEGREEARKEIAHGMKKLLAIDKYRALIIEYLTALIRGRENSMVLPYIADLENQEIVMALKKELVIIARGDIGENQLNAIKALSLIKDDNDIKKSMIILLSHWDSQARFAAAEVLAGMADDKDVRGAAEKRLASETDEDIKKILKKIAGI